MITLGRLMSMRGIRYRTEFSSRAVDIIFDSSERIFLSLGFLVNHCKRFEMEIPENETQSFRSYPITDGITTGGYVMKQAPQYRIYFDTDYNMPDELFDRLQNDRRSSVIRMTGSLFCEACNHLGFVAGSYQDRRIIDMNIRKLIRTQSEADAYEDGLDL